MSYVVALAGQSINTAQIGIETNISSSSATIYNASITNATINQLSTTIFNPVSITTATLQAETGVIDNLVVNNVIDVLNVTELNASRKNVCNISCLNLSASQITCENLQSILTAGQNVTIVDNVISAINEALLPADANFSTIHTSHLNSSILSSTYVNAFNVSSTNGNFSTLNASNLSTGSMKFGDGLLYDPFDSALEVDLTGFVTEGDDRPVTSWGVYKALDNQFSNIQTVWAYTLSEAEFISVASSVPAGGENTICYLDIYPNYENSKIVVEFSFSYTVAGSGTDTIVTEIRVGKNNNATQTVIQELFQQWNNAGGGGTRSGTGGNIKGVYTNTDTIGKFHRIQLRIDNNSDDVWSLDNAAFVSIQVTEFVEIAGFSNPNIRIGSGNISCGNISCNALTSANFTVDNLITTYNVNVGGDMITVGFPQSGSIASKSILRMAGANTVLNQGDLTWDGTTFNLSTRQANKNFKVSFGQQDYFEVNTNNTSCKSLQVNGNINVTGSLTVGGTFLFSNAIIEQSLLVNGLITASDAEFSSDVTFDDNVSMHKRLNVSNVSVTQGLTVYGNISTRGNISANSIYAPNISTGSLKPGTNITIVDGFINAYVEGGSLVDCGSLLVDNDANIFGILNVSKTSTFSESLNVCNIIYAGKSGQHDGSVVIYSQTVGNNWATKFDGTVLNMSATGTAVNTWLGSDKILSITPTGVNICGTLKADAIDADYQNFSSVNISVSNDLNVSNQTTLNNVSLINLSANQTTSSIIDVTQINGINGHFSSTLTAPNISTGSLVFGTGLTYFLGVLTVDFTTSETQVANLANSLALQVDTDTLIAGLATIDALSVSVLIQTPEINVSQLNCSDIDANSGTIDVLDTTNLSTVYLSSDTISCDVLDVNTSITTRHINCSTLSLTDTIGSTGLNVCGTAYIDALFVYGGTQFETDNVYFGKPETGTNSRINFWSLANAAEVGARFGLNAGNILRLDVPSFGGVSTYNILMSNVSTMTMTNTSTRFHQALNVSGLLTVSNISSSRANFTTDIITPKVTTEALNTSSNMMFNILNVPSMELSDAFYLYTDLRGTNLYSSENICGTNGSFNNLSLHSLSVTTITSPSLTTANMSIGTGLDFSNNVLTAAAISLTAGNNIQIIGDEISTTSSISVSSIAVNTSITASFINTTSSKTNALNVCGAALLDSLTVYGVGTTSLGTGYVSIGKQNGTDPTSLLIFSTFNVPNTIGLQFGLDTDSVARIKIPDFGQFPRFNITIGNVSYLTMFNNSTRFERNVIFGNDVTATKITSTNICNTNMSITNGTITTLRGTTLNGTTINASNLNLSTKLSTTNISATNFSTTNGTITTLRGTTLNGTTINASNLNISTLLTTTNISSTNITATSITAPNVQQTLTAGTNITIIGNTISAEGGTTLTAGNNIQIVGDVISTTANLNSSNISSINGSYTNLTCSGNISFPIGNYLFRNPLDGILNVCSTTVSTALIGPLRTSFNSSLIQTNKLNVSNISFVGGIGGGVLDMGDLNSITKAFSVTSGSVNSSTLNASNIVVHTKVTAPNISSDRANFSTDIITPKITLNTINTSSTLSFKVDNFTYMEFTEDLFLLYTALKAPNIECTQNICGNNGSFTNLSTLTLTATSIVAPNVQPTLTAGTGINISGTTISAGGTTLTAGNNISILNDVISTTANINISNISCINCSFTNISSTRLNANIVTGILINTSDINCSTKISCTNLSVFTLLSVPTGKITTVNSTTLNGVIVNASNLNISTKLTVRNVSATAITATSVTAPDVQPLLTAGTGINISGTTISATSYTAGNNIQIVGDVISTTANINCSDIDTETGTIDVFDSTFATLTNLSSTNFSCGLVTTTTLQATTNNGTTMNCSTINISTDIISPRFNVTKVVNQLTNRFAVGSTATEVTVATNFVTNGGRIVILVETGAYRTADGNGILTVRLKNPAGVTVYSFGTQHFYNQTNVHLQWSRMYVTPAVADTYSVTFVRNDTNLIHDMNDRLNVTIMEYPF